MAAYSGRHSRMFAWDAETLEILGYQDIKARVELMDVSFDGRYCAYFAEAHAKNEHYIAICRPPFFHALWIRNCFHSGNHDVVFESGKSVRFFYTKKSEAWNERMVPEYTAPNAPMRFKEIDELAPREVWIGMAARRCSGAVEKTVYPMVQGRPTKRSLWSATDCLNRIITVDNGAILADGALFLDCTQTPFETIPPPEWATEW